MKNKLSVIIPLIVLLLGIAVFFYPTFANYLNNFTQTKSVKTYADNVDKLNEKEYARILDEAIKYNEDIAENGIRWRMSDEDKAKYSAVLNPTGKGMMAFIEIPKIDAVLAVYHGSNDDVLLRSVGHIEGSSLPVAGESVHCILSGHRGLPSAKLFSDLDKLTTGDKFIIKTLNEVYTYEVDKINIVEPNDLSMLKIEKGKNYCTLVTCTPYGSNTQRLLVRGQLTDTDDSRDITILAEALQINSTYIAASIAVPILIYLSLAAMFFRKKPE